jgi:hypothetical protein
MPELNAPCVTSELGVQGREALGLLGFTIGAVIGGGVGLAFKVIRAAPELGAARAANATGSVDVVRRLELPLVAFCPGCGCSVTFHDALYRIGSETIAHCENCGPCWKTSNTAFLELVLRQLGINTVT